MVSPLLVVAVRTISRVALPPQPATINTEAARAASSRDRRIPPDVSGAEGRSAHFPVRLSRPQFAEKEEPLSRGRRFLSLRQWVYCRHAESAGDDIRGAGDPVPWGESRGESAGGAGSFSASPSANPAGPRKRILRVASLILPSLAALALAGAPAASAAGGANPGGSGSGSSSAGCRVIRRNVTVRRDGDVRRRRDRRQPAGLPFPRPTVPGTTGKIIHGLAYAPADAPLQVQEVIWAGDRIRLKPYRVRRRARQVERRRIRLLGHGLVRPARRRPAQGVRWTPASSMTLGQAWRRPVDHGLHESGARVHRDRRDPTRHLGRAGPASGAGHRPTVAAADDEHDWIHGPPPRRVLALEHVRSPVHRGAGDVRAGARPRYA